MIKYLLFLISVLHHINGQNQITFIMNCLTPEKCQMSLETLSEKFEKCGGTKEAPKYLCPRVIYQRVLTTQPLEKRNF